MCHARDLGTVSRSRGFATEAGTVRMGQTRIRPSVVRLTNSSSDSNYNSDYIVIVIVIYSESGSE